MQTPKSVRTRKRYAAFTIIGLFILLYLGLLALGFLIFAIIENDHINAGVTVTSFFASFILLVLLVIVSRTYIFTEIFDKGRHIRSWSVAIIITIIVFNLVIRGMSFFPVVNLKNFFSGGDYFYYLREQFSLLALASRADLALLIIGGLTFLLPVFGSLFSKQVNRIKELVFRYGLIVFNIFFLVLLLFRALALYTSQFNVIFMYNDYQNHWSFPELVSLDYSLSTLASSVTAILIAIVFFSTKHSSKRKRILNVCIAIFVIVATADALIDLEVLTIVSTIDERINFIISLGILLGISIPATLIAWTKYEGLRQAEEEKQKELQALQIQRNPYSERRKALFDKYTEALTTADNMFQEIQEMDKTYQEHLVALTSLEEKIASKTKEQTQLEAFIDRLKEEKPEIAKDFISLLAEHNAERDAEQAVEDAKQNKRNFRANVLFSVFSAVLGAILGGGVTLLLEVVKH